MNPPEGPAAAPPTETVTERGSTPAAVLNTVRWSDPARWLQAGWRDFRRAPGIGLFYGTCFTVMGWALLIVFQSSPAYVLALSGGFLLVGPFMCLGMYRVSQRLENGERPGFADSVLAWQARTGQLAVFGVVLLVLEMLWARATLVVFAVTFDGLPDFHGSLLALVSGENLVFLVVWLALGALFATLIYSVSVVSMPMILHRRTDAITAGLTSMRLVLTQTPVMIFWGASIAVLVFAAMLPGFVGLLIVGPVLGHASWHAYRAAVRD
ncbi:MAG: DUF2189 domain-containing protein [Betaproteobacteria bacterium]|nr:DUF2189 domain-containing protein [Betaproteobacteria bacterium]